MKAKIAKEPTREDRVRRLLKLAAFLDRLPKKKFYMGEWCAGWNEEKGCGTTACMFGWLPAIPFFKKIGLSYRPGPYDSTEILFRGSWHPPHLIGAEIFGLEKYEASNLFIPTGKMLGLPMMSFNATPREAAKYLRRFVRAKLRALKAA